MILYLKKNIDDLNRGWNYNRATHFIFDVGTSMIPEGSSTRLGKITFYDGAYRDITKKIC